MNVLIACEESQAVCIAMREKGNNAFSCDIIECSGNHPEWHICQDVIPLLGGNCDFTDSTGGKHHIEGKWDMIIGHPPCTYLSNAGAKHLFPSGVLNNDRYELGLKAKAFFMEILNADCDKIAVENPIPSRIYELPQYSQIIQPWQFGHPFQKKTCLWLKNLPLLEPTNILPEDMREPTTKATWFNSGGSTARQRRRSKTFPGIAQAMAEQWTNPKA